jgi:hypothetical protein
MVETKQFAWSDIKVRALGRDFVGIRGISYKRTVENEHLHGRGSKPIAIQRGNETCEGEITLLQSELEALTSALDVSDLTKTRFDVVVTYERNDKVVTDIVKSVQCKEYEKGMSQGDKYMEISIPFLALDILENQ